EKDNRIINFFLITSFIFMIVFFSLIFLTTSPWEEITPSMLSLWISFDVSLSVVIYALILTFGIIRFNQDRMYRDFILLVLSVNMIVIAFLFFITHPVHAGSLPGIASREKNRTICVYLATVGLLCIGSLNSFSRKKVTDGINKIITVSCFILAPCFMIVSVFNPNFVILTYIPGTGITILGYVFILALISVVISNLVIFLNHWRKRREWFDLSIVIATAFWFSAITSFSLQTSPYQLMETIWPILSATGYALLAGALMMDAILDPYRGLETKVSQIDEALRNSEEKLQLALRGADLGVWDWFSISNMYVIDGRFAEILGYEKKEMILTYQNWRDLVHPDDFDLALSRWIEHIQGELPIYSSEHRLRRKTGEYVWVLERGTVQEIEPSGDSRRATGTILDITELIRSQEETKQLAEIATFYLDLMGHDIRNKLQAIMIGIGILQDLDQDGNSQNVIDLTIQAVESCQRIIKGIYSTEGLIASSLYDTDLCEILHTSVQQLNHILEDVEVDIKVPESHCMIQANEYANILINNLLDNAIRHNDSDQKCLWLEIKTEKNSYQLIISDNGPGITDSLKESIFQPDRRFGGIGVHQVRRITEKYGGSIQLKDRVKGDSSQGTMVVISFPKRT
ncbi:MAG: PAS domain-containing protein, partial [Candidatus Thorarchaeota archaeon]|nr:PAS domain-containing protein [Candidatus Thorarchaeota archaeon]